jgi:hypothetical protein
VAKALEVARLEAEVQLQFEGNDLVHHVVVETKGAGQDLLVVINVCGLKQILHFYKKKLSPCAEQTFVLSCLPSWWNQQTILQSCKL